MTSDTSTIVCGALTPTLSAADARPMIENRLPEWCLAEDGCKITRTIKTKGFAKATYLNGLAIYLADKSGHHPDIKFGWGYFEISYTTHEANGLTEIDIACAEKFDSCVG